VATILVVDDEPDIRLLTKLNLERDGHTIVTAGNGTEALAAVSDAPPDLILLDVMMPEVDGWAVLEQLKAQRGNAISDIPVVLITALGGPMDRVKGGIEGPERAQRLKAQQQALEMLARIERNVPPTTIDNAPRPRLSGLERGPSPARPEPAVPRIAEERLASLTDKQRELLDAVAQASTIMEAATGLHMSRSNVYASLRRISRKLGTYSVRELLETLRRGDLSR
jgi:CheY-like chemotaxis protein